MAQALRNATTQNFVQKTLGASLLTGVTAAATLNNVTSIQNLPGVMIVDRVDSNGVETPTKREVIQYAATSGVTVTTLTRNADGSGTDQDHAVGAIVEFGPDILWAQSVIDGLTQVVVAATGLLDTTKVVDLTTAQTLTNKTLTSPVIRAYDGWIDANETWTYATASTITVPTGAASKYQKGDRIKWTQTTVKYGVIVAVADTLLTIAVNTDYVVTNAAISANYYSHQANPIGYPGWFNCTLSPTGLTSILEGSIFSIVGNMCTVTGVISGTSNAASLNITLPAIASANSVGSINLVGTTVLDNGSWLSTPGLLGLAVGGVASATAKFAINAATGIPGNAYGGFTATGGKGVVSTFSYQF